MKPGKRQREIIEALKSGAELVQRDGRWRLENGMSYFVDKERCMGLYVRGFIMADGMASNGGFLYKLTEKGKRA